MKLANRIIPALKPSDEDMALMGCEIQCPLNGTLTTFFRLNAPILAHYVGPWIADDMAMASLLIFDIKAGLHTTTRWKSDE